MQELREDSVRVIVNNPEEIDTLYSWMDVGSTLANKMRNNLTDTDTDLIDRLDNLISSVVLRQDVVLYRGITTDYRSSTIQCHVFIRGHSRYLW
jgi:hypothetical protein